MSDIHTKQVLSDTVVPMQAGLKNNRAQAELEKIAAQKTQSARNIYAQGERNSAAKLMADAYAQYGDDPTALAAELDAIKAKKVQEIVDPAVLSSFVTDYDLKSTSYIANAKRNFTTAQRKEQKSTLNDAFSDSINEIAENALGMFESDDDDIKVGYMHAKQTATDAIEAKGDNGLNIFTDSERNRGTKQISKGALVGLQNFVNAPDADPVRIKQVIKRFNEGAYDGMFNEEDKARAARLLKAAGKAADKAISGGSDKENGDWGWIQAQGIQDEIEDYAKSIKGDTKISYDKLGQIIDLRAQILDQYEKGAIGEKQYKNLMNKSSATALNSIEAYINSSGGNTWFSTEHPTHMGLRAINAVAGDALSGLSADQKLYLYEDFLRRYKAEGGTDERNDEQKNMALSIAKKVAQDFTVATYPAYDPKTSSAIVVGKKVWDFGADRKTVNNKHYQDFEIDDKDDK